MSFLNDLKAIGVDVDEPTANAAAQDVTLDVNHPDYEPVEKKLVVGSPTAQAPLCLRGLSNTIQGT